MTFFLNKSMRAFFVRVCFHLVGFVFCQSSLRLRQCGFERPGINLKKEVAFLYYAALLVIARDNVALHLRVDVGVDETIQRRDAFQHARHVARLTVVTRTSGGGGAVGAGLREQLETTNDAISKQRQPARESCFIMFIITLSRLRRNYPALWYARSVPMSFFRVTCLSAVLEADARSISAREAT